MSKRKPIDKAEARERRNRMLASAAAASLSLADGVREMRVIAGMTQEEFARHRGVSTRVIKAIELDQGNPTVATLNRIGHFFGLEVAFVPIKRNRQAEDRAAPVDDDMITQGDDIDFSERIRKMVEMRDELAVRMRNLDKMVNDIDANLGIIQEQHKTLESMANSSHALAQEMHDTQKNTASGKARGRPNKKPRLP